ncbi:ANTAR domain-containing response regulator [Desulfoscipio geothermicus]|uniref:Stage 0 sporulation protein A homolog n=1 Tax=Desulfoscipio geothermicus DSM 3669 TaxID=1121426 RepID=A0A1I6DPP1_9FIRM|nr:ANTAR domain-containing protein [Desulfoscipio geothermicus]SFR07347.1 response regulator receiver and ANTAR domain protein [Desulfoscipio geothermicus DSM 3669]
MLGTRIMLANADKVLHQQLMEILQRSGYVVVAEPADAKAALQEALKYEPDVIVVDDNLPGGSLMFAGYIREHNLAPVVLITSYSEKDMMEISRVPGIFGIITKPVHESYVLPVVEVAINAFNNILSLEREIKKYKQELENRKLLERAKGLLMDRRSMSESEAFRYMQKISMDKCIPITKVAKNIIVKLQKQ